MSSLSVSLFVLILVGSWVEQGSALTCYSCTAFFSMGQDCVTVSSKTATTRCPNGCQTVIGNILSLS